jgi:hypothetical protein
MVDSRGGVVILMAMGLELHTTLAFHWRADGVAARCEWFRENLNRW